MTNPQEEVLRAWENIKLISNPAWVTKPDGYIKANQRLWSWKCAQESREHLYRDTYHQQFENSTNDDLHFEESSQIDITCKIRSVKDTIPQSRLAKYYGNFYYDESRESLYTDENHSYSHTQLKSLTSPKDDVTECWMLPEVDYWYKMLTENENVFSSQESKIVINDVPICAQKVDTIQQVVSQKSLLTTSIYETSCLFKEKIIAEDPQESGCNPKRESRDLPKWITYLDQIYPDLKLSLHFLQKIPFKTFSLYSSKKHNHHEEIQANSWTKFPIQSNTEDEKKLHEHLLSSCIQNIWKCDYCNSKNCVEKSHINVKNPTFYFTPESISALQKSIVDFRCQIKNLYTNDFHQRYTINNDQPRKIRHDKRRFKNKAINKTKSQKETKYLENSISKSVGALPENTENTPEENAPNQVLKEFFDHFRNAANKSYAQTAKGLCSNSYSTHCASLESHLTSLTNNNSKVVQTKREGNVDFLKNNDKAMKSVSSQTYSNDTVLNRSGNSKSFKNNKGNQNKANTKKKLSADKNGNFSKYGGYSPKTSLSSSFSNIKSDNCNAADGKKITENSYGQNSKSKNGSSSKKKSSNKKKTAQVNSGENVERNYSHTPKKITILNKSHNNTKHDEEEKSKKQYSAPCIEFEKLVINNEGETSGINEHHNLSKAWGGEAFIQNYTFAQCYDKKCVVYKEDPVSSYRKRLYSDVLSGNSNALLLNEDNCNTSQMNPFTLEENYTNKSQNMDPEHNPMVILNSSSPSNILDVSSIEAQFEKLEIEAMEQYKTSDESIDKKFDELEKEALAQYVDTSDSFTSCKDEGESCIRNSPETNEEKEMVMNNRNVKDVGVVDNEKTKTHNSFVIYSKASGNKKGKNVKKCKTHK